MTTLSNNGSNGGFRAFLRGLFRVVLVLAAGAVIGVAGFFGVSYLYDQATRPAEDNRLQLESMATRQAFRDEQTADRLETYNERLTDLEVFSDLTEEDLDLLLSDQENFDDVLALLEERLAALEVQAMRQERHLSALATAQMAQARQATLEARRSPTPEPTDMVTLPELAREVKLLMSMELLSRARIQFLDANYGLAVQDMENARQELIDLATSELVQQEGEVDVAIAHLSTAMMSLPDHPKAAANDLDTAWQVLVDLLVAEATPTALAELNPLTTTPTPTPYRLTREPTATVTATPTSTGTPYPPFSVTPTPWGTNTPYPTPTSNES